LLGGDVTPPCTFPTMECARFRFLEQLDIDGQAWAEIGPIQQ
jgi:hypothetical protein